MIDNSSLYRMDPDVPLIVPEVNPEAIDGYRARNIIANPNCSTAQMVVALKPLHDAAKIKRVVVATYQSVRARAKRAWTSCSSRAATSSSATPIRRVKFTKQIAFNVIPHIDAFLDDGSTKEEWKMVVETKKILGSDDQGQRDLRPRAGVRRPFGSDQHRVRERDLGRRGAGILREAPGIMLVDKREDGGYVTPVECVGDYATFVSRVREDPTVDNGLSHLGGQRQPPQGRGAQRGPDRRTARPPPSAESGLVYPSDEANSAGSPAAAHAHAASSRSRSLRASAPSSDTVARLAASEIRLWTKVNAASRSPRVTGSTSCSMVAG